MRLTHLPLLFCSLFCCISQAQSPFRVADSLSTASSYLASNKVLEAYLQDNPRRLHDQSRAWFLISYNYLQLGNFKEAEAANARSMELRNQLLSGDIAENYMRSGAIALQQGNYEKALDYLFMTTSMPIEEPRLYALIYGYIASAFEGLGQPEKALNYYRQSLETLESATEGSEADVATNYYNIGRVYLQQDKLEAAKATFKQALNTTNQVQGRKDIRGNILNALGETMQQDTPSVAVSYYHAALNLYRSAYGNHHRETARTLLNLGQLYFNLNEPDSALFYANAAIRALCPGTAFKGNTLREDEALMALDRPLLVLALHLHSALSLQKGDFNGTMEHSRTVINLLVGETRLLGDETSRLRLLANTTDVFEVFVEAAYQVYQKNKDIRALHRGFDLAELSKALLLRMTLANVTTDSLLPADLAKEEATLRTSLRDAESARLLQPENQSLREKVQELRMEYHDLFTRIVADYPAFEKNYQGQRPMMAEDLQKQLAADDILLSYFIGQTDYYIFALTKTGALVKKITKSRDFKAEDSKAQKLVKKMMRFQEKPMGTGPGTYSKFDASKMATDLDGALKGFLQSIKKSDSEQFPHYAQLLYDRLVLPMDSVLKDKKRLLIVPHKGLFAIPFEAFISGFLPEMEETPKTPYHKFNYLVKSYTVQYNYMSTLFFESQKPAKPVVNDFLGMAPVFDNNASQSYIWDSNLFAFDTTYQGSYSMRDATPDGLSFQALPESERETVAISKLFAKNKKPALAFLRLEADEARFKENAGRHSILHLATHSFVNYANPALSGIAFSQPNIGKPDTEDGILYATEIAGLDLKNVDLVTLSSCESGSGPASGNEGALSLTRSFLSAGAPNVVSSLWKVYDTYTAQLMRFFYEQALDDKTYVQALRQAKLKMIKDSKSADPRKWSGFVLFGSL